MRTTPENLIAARWPPSIRAILLDVGNTLVFADWPTILLPLAGSGTYPSPEQLRSAEAGARRWLDNTLYGGAETVDHDFWTVYFEFLAMELGLQDWDLKRQLVARARRASHWTKPAPGTRETLEELRRRYLLGVISNSDGSVAQLLQSLGLDDLFTCVIDSGVVKVHKPNPAIFHMAAKDLRVNAVDCCYVGDMYSVDYVGARAAGMHAILFDPGGSYGGLPVLRVTSLRNLADWALGASQ